MTRAAFHKARALGIGGSDAPAVMGQDPWRSPLELYARKVAAIDGRPRARVGMRDPRLAEAMEIGTEIESFLARLFTKRTGIRLRRWRKQLVDKEHPFMRCHVDRFGYDPERGRGVVQFKNRGGLPRGWVDAPIDEVALDNADARRTLIQTQHEMHVAGCRWGAIGVLLAGNQFKVYDVERNDAFVEVMVRVEAAFWRCIENRTPPDLSRDPFADARGLMSLYPREVAGKVVACNADIQFAVDEIDSLRAAAKRAEREAEAHANVVKAFLGDAEVGQLPDGSLVRWRVEPRMRVDPVKLRAIAPRVAKRATVTTYPRVLRHVKGNKHE